MATMEEVQASMPDPNATVLPPMSPGRQKMVKALEIYGNNAPSISASMAATTWRSSNTMLSGGFSPNYATGIIDNSYFNPRAWARYGDQSIFRPHADMAGLKKGKFTPFQSAGMVDNIFQRAGKLGAGQVKSTGFRRVTDPLLKPISKRVAESETFKSGSSLIHTGITADMVTSARLGFQGGGAIGDTVAMNLNRTLYARAGGDLGQFKNVIHFRKPDVPVGPAGPFSGAMTGAEARQMFHATAIGNSYVGDVIHSTIGNMRYGEEVFGEMVAKHGKGELLDRAGYKLGQKIASKTAGRLGLQGVENVTVRQVGNAVKKKTMEEVTTLAAKKLGQEAGEIAFKDAAKAIGTRATVEIGTKMAARGGVMLANLGAGPVGWAIDIGMAAWMAYDMAKLGGELAKEFVVKPTVQFMKDANSSFMGQIRKSPFGMGYKDTTVAATARARGVQAIQNSRLNARSILGAEAAGMHAHFG